MGQCYRCDLFNKANTVKVAPRKLGNPAEGCIMVVGEAPGKNEDIEGQCFVGRAGKMLYSLLEKVGIRDCYLTNVVRCAPWGEYKIGRPNKKHIKACLSYLLNEIEELQPSVIIALGNVAAGALTGEGTGIGKKCGQVRDIDISDLDADFSGKYKVVLCIHPAALLRQGIGYVDSIDDVETTSYGLKALEAFSNAKRVYEGSFRSSYGKLTKGFVPKEGLPECGVGKEYITDVLVIESLEQLEMFDTWIRCRFKGGKINCLAFDVETNSLNPYDIESKILCVQFSWGDGLSVVLPVEHPDSPFVEDGVFLLDIRAAMAKWLGSILSTVPIVGQNIKFDCQWVMSQFNITDYTIYMDTMLAEHALKAGTRNLTLDLDTIAKRRLDVPIYSHMIKEYLIEYKKDEQTYDKVPGEELYKYGGIDTDVTLRVAKQQEKELKSAGLWDMYKEFYVAAVKVTAEMEYSGCKVDTLKREELDEEYKNLMELYTDEIRQSKYFDAFKEKSEVDDINLNSYAQKACLLYDVMGLPVLKKTAHKQPSTDKETLELLLGGEGSDKLSVEESNILVGLQEYTTTSTLHSAFVKNLPNVWTVEGTPDFWKHLTGEKVRHDDYFLHSNFLIGLAETGRWRNKEPNLQQLPRKSSIKKMIVSRFPGGLITLADYSQLELRCISMVSECKGMKDLFLSGEDVHRSMAARIFSKDLKDVTGEERFRAKTVSFGIIYSIGAKHLGRVCKMSKEEAQEMIDNLYDRFPEIAVWKKQQMDFAAESGFIYSPFGKIRYLPDFAEAEVERNADRAQDLKSAGERKAVNTPIQGMASDINQLGMMYLCRDLEKYKMLSRIFAIIHDSIENDTNPAEFLRLIRLMHENMVIKVSDRIKDFQFGVPLEVGFEFGTSWGELLKADSYTIDGDSVIFDVTGTPESFQKAGLSLLQYFTVDYMEEREAVEEDEVRWVIRVGERT